MRNNLDSLTASVLLRTHAKMCAPSVSTFTGQITKLAHFKFHRIQSIGASMTTTMCTLLPRVVQTWRCGPCFFKDCFFRKINGYSPITRISACIGRRFMTAAPGQH